MAERARGDGKEASQVHGKKRREGSGAGENVEKEEARGGSGRADS